METNAQHLQYVFFHKKRKIWNNCGKECFLKRAYFQLFGIHINYTKNPYTKYRAPYFSKGLMFGIFCFVDSEAFIGYRAEKKQKKCKEKQKSWETCPQRFPSQDCFFVCFLLVVFEFFGVAYVGHNNQNQHFWVVQKSKPPLLGGAFQLKGLCEQQTPNNYGMEITRAHRVKKTQWVQDMRAFCRPYSGRSGI